MKTRINENGSWKKAREIEKQLIGATKAHQDLMDQYVKSYMKIKDLTLKLTESLPESDVSYHDSPFALNRIRHSLDGYWKKIGMEGIKGFFPADTPDFTEYLSDCLKWAFKFEKKDEKAS